MTGRKIKMKDKNKLSIMLYGLSFLIALLGEIYLMNVPKQDLFSIIGIGIVVILTGYLLFDTVWEHITHRNQNTMQLWIEQRIQESEKQDLIHKEMLNIQKATYVALKKGIKNTDEELEHIIKLMDELKDNNLNTTISDEYLTKHAREVIEAIREICSGNNYEEQLKEIINLLNSYNEKDNTYKH